MQPIKVLSDRVVFVALLSFKVSSVQTTGEKETDLVDDSPKPETVPVLEKRKVSKSCNRYHFPFLPLLSGCIIRFRF